MSPADLRRRAGGQGIRFRVKGLGYRLGGPPPRIRVIKGIYEDPKQSPFWEGGPPEV